MSDTDLVWIGDGVRLHPDALTVDNKPIEDSFKDTKRNWIVTDYKRETDEVYLGAYSAFGVPVSKSPPLIVHSKYVSLIPERTVCRHPAHLREVLPAVSPTCTTPGLGSGVRCSCGKILHEQTIIPAIGHQYEDNFDVGTSVCMLCKHEEKIQKKNLTLRKQDIRAMIHIIENMLNESTQKTEPVAFNNSWWNNNFTHTATSSTYNSIKYQFIESSVFDAQADAPYKLPLIVWFSDKNVGSEELFEESLWSSTERLNKSASHVLVPKFSGNFIASKREFYNLLEDLISRYYIDESKIILMGEGLGGAAVEFFMYQDPDKFSYQVIINGSSSSVDIKSIIDVKSKTSLYSDGTSPHMDYLASVFELDCIDCKSVDDALRNGIITSKSLNAILSRTNSTTVMSPGTYSVKTSSYKLKKDTSTYAEDSNITVLRGHRLVLTDMKQAQNYTWGKVSKDITSGIESTDLWIPVEHMFTDDAAKDTMYRSEYIVPCYFSGIGTKFGNVVQGKKTVVHNGIDLITTEGSPVFAMKGGIVEEVSKSIEYGTTLKTSNGQYHIIYSHLSDTNLHVGDNIYGGQFIGVVALPPETSVTEEPHIHIGVLKDDSWIDPKTLRTPTSN